MSSVPPTFTPPPLPTTRRCCKCGETKSLDEFPVARREKLQRGRWCKLCKAEYERGYAERRRRKVDDAMRERNNQQARERRALKKAGLPPRPRKVAAFAYAAPPPVLPKEIRARAHWLRRNYGIGLNDYADLWFAQGGVCAICGRPETMKHYRDGTPWMLTVDHCHTTQRVRALLCNACNLGIGHFADSVDRLERALAYLRKHAALSD